MEEKILIKSEQYNIKKIVRIICSVVVLLSIIATIGMYIIYCVNNYNVSKANYENHYIYDKESAINEYNNILENYETEENQDIECYHTEYTYGYYNGYQYKAIVPMSKDEFLEKHSSAETYMWCAHGLHDYDSFEEYAGSFFEIGDNQKVGAALPLLANILIPLIFLVYMWLRSYSLVITDKRIYGKAAFGKRVDLPLDSVSAVGTSALKGVAVGTSSGKIKFKLIKNQKEIHEVISKLLAERQRREKTPVETTVNQTIVETSNADELKKFKELLDMGAITQEEFDAKKKELLGL